MEAAARAEARQVFDKSVAAQPAVEVWQLSVVRVLLKIFESALRQSCPTPVQLVEIVAMEVSIFAMYPRDVCDPWSQLWLGFERKSRSR